MSSDVAAAERLCRREVEVRRLGTYIGAFELVAWSAMENVPVKLVVGGSVHDLREFYAGHLPPMSASAPSHYFVASQGAMAVDTRHGHPNFNHYMVGVPIRGRSHDSIDPVDGTQTARLVCFRLGFGLVTTQAAGDCGFDVMCYHRGCARDSSTFKKVRFELSKFMMRMAGDSSWQLCFEHCCESNFNPTADAGRSRPSQKAALAKWFQQPYPLLANSKLERPPPVRTLVASCTPTASTLVQSALAPSSKPYQDSSLPNTDVVGTSVRSDAIAPARPTTSRQWLLSMAPEELALVTNNQFTFMEVRKQWREPSTRAIY